LALKGVTSVQKKQDDTCYHLSGILNAIAGFRQADRGLIDSHLGLIFRCKLWMSRCVLALLERDIRARLRGYDWGDPTPPPLIEHIDGRAS